MCGRCNEPITRVDNHWASEKTGSWCIDEKTHEPVLTTDELFAEMDKHEFEGATKISPRDYGKMRGISPQLVYYHIRQGHLTKEVCNCGRSVIDIDLADKYFSKGVYADAQD